MPDNCAVDNQGRLWIATDGNRPRAPAGATASGRWRPKATARGTSKLSSAAERGRDVRSAISRRTTRRSFVAVQHPGEADDDDPNAAPATFETPSTRWPDFKPDMPPRPSIVVVTKRGGGKIAG